MKKNAGSMQMESLKLTQQINDLIKNADNLDVESKIDFIKNNANLFISYGRDFLKMEYSYQKEETQKKILEIVEKCSNSDILQFPDICTISNLMIDLEYVTDDIILSHKEGQKVCECCGQNVFYRALPSYYKEQEILHNAEQHIPETLNEYEYECPSCGATDRDRLMILMLKKLGLDCNTAKESLLQIAPSKAIEHWINANCYTLQYESTDLYMNGVTFVSDIQNMTMVNDGKYDYIICSHVLEHVQDDKKAMKELCRILKKNGFGLFLVPIALDMNEIDEEWGLPADENWRRFGQDDHCRRYYKNGFVERLQDSGFYVHQLGKDFFGEADFKRNGLTDTSVLYVVTKEEGTIESLISKKNADRKEYNPPKPLVSVIMSAYNHEAYVSDAIESVLSQTYDNIEFLVADDNSTDRTADVICRYDERINEIHLFDENAYGRLNFLSDIARGKYIAVINSDDVWEKDKLQKQVLYMETHPEVAACFTGVQCFDDAGKDVDDDVFIAQNMTKEEWIRFFLRRDNCLAHPSVLIRTELYQFLQHSGIYAFRQVPDLWMWIKIIQKYDIHVIEKPETRFRFHESGGNANTSARVEENTIRHFWEESYMWYDVMKNMDNEYFIKAFYEDMLDKNAHTDEEIMCEKFFVLSKLKPAIKQAILFLLYDICQNERVVSILKEKYNFKLADIYKLSGR